MNTTIEVKNMSRSRARKNRNKYKTLRRLGVFKIFVMDYPNPNRRVYPALNFGTMKFSKEFIHEINHPQGSFIGVSSQVKESVRDAIKMEYDIKRERFRDPAISKLHGDDDLNWAISPWPTKLNFAGIWSNPVDTSNLQGPSIEELRIEDMVHKAKHVISENTRQHIIAIAESIGEDIDVDTFLLRGDIKVFRQQNNVWNLIPVDYDSHEWAIVIIALHRRPEILDHLKSKGYDFIHIQRTSKDETIVDTYYVIDIANSNDVEAFKPFRIEPSIDFTAAEMIGDDINRFATRIVGDNILCWDMVKDR